VFVSWLRPRPGLGADRRVVERPQGQAGDGVTSNADNPTPDSITDPRLGVQPVKVLGTISNVPGSVVGPPLSSPSRRTKRWRWSRLDADRSGRQDQDQARRSE
jgi:hypothetical protein